MIDDFLNNHALNIFINLIKLPFLFIKNIIIGLVILLKFLRKFFNFIPALIMLISYLGLLYLLTLVLSSDIAYSIKIKHITYLNIQYNHIPILIFLITIIIFNIYDMGYFKKLLKNFESLTFINTENIPEITNFSFIDKLGIFSITIKTIIPLHIWEKNKNDIEFIFNSGIMTLKHSGNKKLTFVFAPQFLIDNINKKEIVNFKDAELSIENRLKSVFEYLEFDINSIYKYESILSTIIYFNSDIEYLKMTNYMTELKHRLKLNNMILETSDIEKFDYMIQIFKSIKEITFLKVFEEIYNKLNKMDIPILSGIDSKGNIIIEDLKQKVHFLIGGTTGSGKTNHSHNLICSSLLMNKNISMVIIDIKNDLNMYKEIDNVLWINEINKIVELTELLIIDLKKRSNLFSTVPFCKDIETYNNKTGDNIPYIVLFVEEIAEIQSQASKEQWKIIEGNFESIAQLSRSLGYRVIFSTQKPNVDIISTIIKGNCPTRLCFKVLNKIESNVILDNGNGSKISQVGQYIYQHYGIEKIIQSVYIPENEHIEIIEYLKQRNNFIEHKETIEHKKNRHININKMI